MKSTSIERRLAFVQHTGLGLWVSWYCPAGNTFRHGQLPCKCTIAQHLEGYWYKKARKCNEMVATNLFCESASFMLYSLVYFIGQIPHTVRLHRTVFVFFCLTYFTEHNALQVHPGCCKWQMSFFVWPSSIPLAYVCVYICVCVYVCVCVCLSIQCIFFIHSSVDGHTGFFCILAIANIAAMSFGLHLSFPFHVFACNL